ncbi:MAG TPA: response regulator [Burkholderiales bacterium]|nr:response regulator [Burkholderiales bacterium]
MAKRVLIADDEPNIVVSLEFLMERCGYTVMVARNGQDALRQTETFKPHLILLDVMLPLRSGFDVCQKIRENKSLQATKIIMLSAKGRDIEVAKGLALGADAYITKPFGTKELLKQVKQLLGDPS